MFSGIFCIFQSGRFLLIVNWCLKVATASLKIISTVIVCDCVEEGLGMGGIIILKVSFGSYWRINAERLVDCEGSLREFVLTITLRNMCYQLRADVPGNR